ncbi:MAG: hypothetical protein AB7K08_11635 [Microbacteriaceae bacterium]
MTVITDPRGFTWEVVVEDGRVLALSARPHDGHRLTQTWLSAAPLGYLRDAATSFWREVDQATEDTDAAINMTATSEAISAASGEVADLVRHVGTPTSEDFAAAWHETPARRYERDETGSIRASVTRREALRQLFRRPNGQPVSLATIDAWTRDARDAGLIPAATTGSPRDPKTTGKAPGKRKEPT